MLVSTEWLREWVSFELDADQLAERLTMAGLEVDSFSEVARCDEKIVVGQVTAVRAHSGAEDLKVCKVSTGPGSQLSVVCGAPNVKAGGKYPVALPGSVVGGRKIQKSEIHSVESSAMLCSAAELQFGDSSSELMELSDDAPVGQSVNAYLRRDDCVLNLELTPNRADCLSIRGVAREVAIIADTTLGERNESRVEATSTCQVPVQISHPEDCPVFCRRVIESIRADAVTPDWMKERLHRVGLRTIHPVVDITNYVMMELGQPMHAFDTEIIDASEIIVRHSQNGEKLVLLDGDELDLGAGMLLITDRNGPIALAGVMGGESSGIRDTTSNIMLEAAFFSPDAIRRSVSKFGMHTDASHRFERGVDPTGQQSAIERATELILDIAGGDPGPTQEYRADERIDLHRQCMVRHARVNRVIGMEIPHQKVENILQSVSESVSSVNGGWQVVAPAYRFDLAEEHDYVEEVARIYGYNRVPSRLNLKAGRYRDLSEKTVSHASLRDAVQSLGYHEAITYSFVDSGLQAKFQPRPDGFVLSNPIAENMSVMRTSLWPGLIGAFLENYRRSKECIRLFEIGRVFHQDGEIDMLGGISFGIAVPVQWATEQRQVDFFDVKGDVERLLELSDSKDAVDFMPEHCEGLHPGCSAGLYIEDIRIGSIGQVHPEILAEMNSRDSVYVFEIEMKAFLSRELSKYIAISRYPSVTRDLSLVISAEQRIFDITSTIRKIAGDALETLTLFDVYCEIDERRNFQSVAYRLTFRASDRTLTDAEIDISIKKILDQLTTTHNARLRA